MKIKFTLLLVLLYTTFSLSQTTASSQGIVADLTYLDVTVTAGSNQISSSNYAFVATDVGRIIAIKQAYHNAIDLGGNLEFTKPGRIVTATATVASVVDANNATIVFEGDYYTLNPYTNIPFVPVLNQTGLRQAYIYTNNYNAIQSVLDTNVGGIIFDESGIVGINPIYKRSNNNMSLLFDSSLGNVSLSTSAGAKLKLCTEDIGITGGNLPVNEGEAVTGSLGAHHLFSERNLQRLTYVQSGNIKVSMSCIPPDVAGSSWRQFFPSVFHVNFFNGNSVGIIRNVTLENLTWDISTDTGGHDAFWRNVYFNTGNGANIDLDQEQDTTGLMQRFTLKNSDIQAITGINYYSGKLNTSAVHIDNVQLSKISNFTGENGRAEYEGVNPDYPDGKYNFPGQWRFNDSNFTISGDTLTIENNPDFSFYDYPVLTDRSGVLSIQIAPNGTLPSINITTPPNPHRIAEIIDGHRVRIGVPLMSDGEPLDGINSSPITENLTNVSFEVYYSKGSGTSKSQRAEHAAYIHPHVSNNFNEFKVTSWKHDGIVKFYSAGDNIDLAGNPMPDGIVEGIITKAPLYNDFANCDFRDCNGLQISGFHGDAFESDGYNPELEGVHYKFTDCELKLYPGFYVGTFESQGTNTFYSETVNCNIFITNGGNHFRHRGLVYDSELDLEGNKIFSSIGDSFQLDPFSIDFLEPDINVHLDQSTFFDRDYDGLSAITNTHLFIPEVRNGTYKITNNNIPQINIDEGIGQALREHNWYSEGIGDRYSPYSVNTNLIFENVIFNDIPRKINGSFVTDYYSFGNLFTSNNEFLNMNMDITNYQFNNRYGYKALPKPSFIETSKYNGLFKFDYSVLSPVPINASRYWFSYETNNKNPYHLQSNWEDLFVLTCKIQESNYFNLPTNYTGNVLILDFRNEQKETANDFRLMSWGNNAYINPGTEEEPFEFDVEFGTNAILSIYRPRYISGSVGPFNNLSYDSERTLSNLVLKHINRELGEIVTFQVDPKQNRIIEVSSTVDEHYTNIVPPMRLGLKDELLYDSNSTDVYRFDMEYFNATGINYPAVINNNGNVTSIDINNNSNGDAAYFSILQEYTDGRDWDEFKFTLFLNDGTPISFSHVTSLDNNVTGLDGGDIVLNKTNKQYMRHLWTFAAEYGGNTIECYLKNRGGELIFRYPFTENLQATVRIDQGWEVTSQEWVLQSECAENTTWDGTTWDNGLPTVDDLAIINASYNSSTDGEFEACSLEVTATGSLIIEPDTSITIHNDVTNNSATDMFIIRDDASLVMVEDDGEVFANTPIKVEKKWAEHLFTDTPAQNTNKYSLWTSPMIEGDSKINNTFSNSAVTFYFDTSISPDAFDQFGGNENLFPGKGFYIRQNDVSQFDENIPIEFNGQLNTGVIATEVFYEPNATLTNDNFHFFGNPYPSAIDWFEFKADNSDLVQGAVYFWKQVIPTTTGIQAPQWAIFNEMGGLPYDIDNGVSGDETTNGFISTAQGFSMQVKAPGNVEFNNSQRVSGNNTQFFKTQDTNTDRIWLSLRDSDIEAQLLLGFESGCSDDYNLDCDAKFIDEGSAIEFYSVIGNNKLSIQGRDILDNNSTSVPLGFKAVRAGKYTFKIVAEFISTDYQIILEDSLTNTFTDLRASLYDFTLDAAIEDNTRFILHFNYSPPVDASFNFEKACDSFGFDFDFFYTGDSSNVTYLWDFGSNATPQISTDENPMGILFTEGNNNVTLTVTNGGSTDIVSQTVYATDIASVEKGKIMICHNGETKFIKPKKLNEHLAHGDCIGPCDGDIVVCHKGKKTKVVSPEDLDDHLAHGDTLGICDDNSANRSVNPINETNDEDFIGDMLLYPNPTANELNVKLNIDKEFNLIRVVDISGRVVMEQKTNEKAVLFNVSQLTNGLYFITVQNNEEIILTKKFIKK